MTFTVNDGGAANNLGTATRTITVTPINDIPTINPIPGPITINENAGIQSVNLTGITAGGGESQTLTVTASSSNTALIPNVVANLAVNYTSPAPTRRDSLTSTRPYRRDRHGDDHRHGDRQRRHRQRRHHAIHDHANVRRDVVNAVNQAPHARHDQ